MPAAANRRILRQSSREGAAARPEEVRAPRKVRGLVVNHVRGQRVGIAGLRVGQPAPDDRTAGEPIHTRRFLVTQTVGAAVHPDAAAGEPLLSEVARQGLTVAGTRAWLNRQLRPIDRAATARRA